jgi:hypothetical protein
MFKFKIDTGIRKGFKDEDDVELFINKAFDKDSKKHTLLIYVSKIPQFYNTRHFHPPLFYESEEERDTIYKENMNEEFVNIWWANLIDYIQKNKQAHEEASRNSEDVS